MTASPRLSRPGLWLPLMAFSGAAAALAIALLWVAVPRSELAAAPALPATARYAGVNLAGGEFKPGRIPGVFNKDYTYPDAKTAAPFTSVGMTAVRLPIRWERIQPASPGPLDETELRRIDATLRTLASFRLIILDLHNYAMYRAVRLDRSSESTARLVDVWRQLATRYRNNPAIAFGVMNEPNGIAAADWRVLADAAVAAIRATGARNLILVPGTRWTGAHSWNAGGSGSNAAAMAGFRDPASNFAFEFHQYLDSDSSGRATECVDPAKAAARLAPATAFLRRERARGFLAEFGAAPNEQCLAALDSLLDSVDAAPDVWMGWTYWAGGSWWGKYPMSVQPAKGAPKPQMAVLLSHLPKGR